MRDALAAELNLQDQFRRALEGDLNHMIKFVMKRANASMPVGPSPCVWAFSYVKEVCQITHDVRIFYFFIFYSAVGA